MPRRHRQGRRRDGRRPEPEASQPDRRRLEARIDGRRDLRRHPRRREGYRDEAVLEEIDDTSDLGCRQLRPQPGWVVRSRETRSATDLAAELADADALLVRSATTVDTALIASAPRLQ